MSQIAVVGLGRFGSAVAQELIKLGHKVIGIDSREKLVEALADQLAHAVIADATDEAALAELNLPQCDTVVVAIGESLEASLLCVLNLKNLGVKDIWVKATSKAHHSILSRLGVSRIIHPEEEMGIRVAQTLNYPMVNQYMYIGNHLFIIEVLVPERLEGTELVELISDDDAVDVLFIKRKSEIIKNLGQSIWVSRKDVIVLLGRLDALKAIAPRFNDE